MIEEARRDRYKIINRRTASCGCASVAALWRSLWHSKLRRGESLVHAKKSDEALRAETVEPAVGDVNHRQLPQDLTLASTSTYTSTRQFTTSTRSISRRQAVYPPCQPRRSRSRPSTSTPARTRTTSPSPKARSSPS